MSEVRLIQSIERATAILEIIAQEGGAARLQHIAEHTKLGKTTAHTLLQTLDELAPQILSEIKTVATRGFALDLENYQPGLHCVAIPWREGGEVRASIGLSGPSTRLSPQALTDMAWMMMKEVERA